MVFFHICEKKKRHDCVSGFQKVILDSSLQSSSPCSPFNNNLYLFVNIQLVWFILRMSIASQFFVFNPRPLFPFLKPGGHPLASARQSISCAGWISSVYMALGMEKWILKIFLCVMFFWTKHRIWVNASLRRWQKWHS